jgi:hypothetical protein
MIKIVSGYSDKGGSTSAFIDLTNELNNLYKQSGGIFPPKQTNQD